MKVVAIADEMIRAEDMVVGLQAMAAAGHEVEVVAWYHGTVEALQADNIILEQTGANAVTLPADSKRPSWAPRSSSPSSRRSGTTCCAPPLTRDYATSASCAPAPRTFRSSRPNSGSRS